MNSEAHAAVDEIEAPVAPRSAEQTATRGSTRTKRQPPYGVILHNDNLNGFDFVVGVLRKVLNLGKSRAFWLTMKAHVMGRSLVWSGALEVAELKAEQIQSCGPDPRMKAKGAQSLRVSLEPLPGE